MKKKFLVLSLVFVYLATQSQTLSFELDTIQVFKCPANLSPNEAVVLNKLEYFDLKKIQRQVWKIDLKKKEFRVGKKTIAIIRSDSNAKEKWAYIEFLGPKKELYKLALATEKGTEKDLIIVVTLDKDLVNQKGYFGYPIGLKSNANPGGER
jgi:hypothetical protein